MSLTTQITLAKGGEEEMTVPLSQLIVPDLWHIAQALNSDGRVSDGAACARDILTCWHMAHDLHNHIAGQP